MMLCGRCHAKNPNFSLYCEQCGSQLSEVTARAKNNRQQSMPNLQPKESTSELKQYILQCMASGHTITQIKRALQREGYTEQEIQTAFVQAHELKEPSIPKVEHHPLAYSPILQSNDNAKHASMLFIALIAIVIVGGSLIWTTQQGQVGAAIALQQQDDMVGKVIEIINKDKANQIVEDKLVTLDKEQNQFRIEVLGEIKQLFEDQGKTMFDADSIGYDPLPPSPRKKGDFIVESSAAQTQDQFQVRKTSASQFKQDAFGVDERGSGQFVFSNIKYKEPQLESSSSNNFVLNFDKVTRPQGEPDVFQALASGQLAQGTISGIESLATSKLPNDIFLTALQLHVENDLADTPKVVIDGIETVITNNEKMDFNVEIDLLYNPDEVPFYSKSFVGDGDKIAGAQWAYFTLPHAVRPRMLSPNDEFYIRFRLLDATVSPNSPIIAEKLYRFSSGDYPELWRYKE